MTFCNKFCLFLFTLDYLRCLWILLNSLLWPLFTTLDPIEKRAESKKVKPKWSLAIDQFLLATGQKTDLKGPVRFYDTKPNGFFQPDFGQLLKYLFRLQWSISSIHLKCPLIPSIRSDTTILQTNSSIIYRVIVTKTHENGGQVILIKEKIILFFKHSFFFNYSFNPIYHEIFSNWSWG